MLLLSMFEAGDETHTPWVFRVNARNGEVINGEEYGGMIVAPVRLFFELIRLKQGDVARYEASRKLAPVDSNSQISPMHNDRWSGYFEDVENIPPTLTRPTPP